MGVRSKRNLIGTVAKNSKGLSRSISMRYDDMSRRMGFPTMSYVRPAKPQISLRIRAV